MSAHLEQGRALHQAGKLQEAELAYRRALQEQPDNVQALHLLWSVLSQRGDFSAALENIRKAVGHRPTDVTLRYCLATGLLNVGQANAAAEAYREVLRHRPEFADGHFSLGHALQRTGDLEEAKGSFERALQLDPACAPAHTHIGMVLADQGRHEEAVKSFQRALAINPDSAPAHNNLARSLLQLGGFAAAEASYRRALRLNPRLPPAHTGLAQAILALGKHDEAMRHHEEAIRSAPDPSREYSARAMAANYVSGRSAAEMHELHLAFGQRVIQSTRVHENTPDPERPLRIGYVSPDFRTHSVAFFIEPVLAKHDRRKHDVTCYFSSGHPDAVTQRLRRLVSNWRDVARLDDDSLADLVRQDSIDILVDLAGHTEGNRLLAFARKPAPVQATWLGYPTTTGLTAIDYRITDSQVDAPGEPNCNTERPIRLAASYFCYSPPARTNDASVPPAQRSGYVMFGSFNNAAKINDVTISLWSNVLRAIPGARLLLKSWPSSDPAVRDALVQRFASHGIEAGRLDVRQFQQGVGDHLAEYDRVDVALDTFPYNGATTTCEALWMGVPVVSLCGETHASRMGKSILTAAGLSEFVCSGEEEFVAKCVSLAQDLPSLAARRAKLREQVRASPLMDAQRFTRNLEDAYRTMWREWCAGRPA